MSVVSDSVRPIDDCPDLPAFDWSRDYPIHPAVSKKLCGCGRPRKAHQLRCVCGAANPEVGE